MGSNGARDKRPFRVTLDRQWLAKALAEALSEHEVSVFADDGGWIVSIGDARTDQLVMRVLDAIRDTLAKQPSASAHVQLDGHDYVMRGQDHITTTASQPTTAGQAAAEPAAA